jgi:hypothetical protein
MYIKQVYQVFNVDVPASLLEGQAGRFTEMESVRMYQSSLERKRVHQSRLEFELDSLYRSITVPIQVAWAHYALPKGQRLTAEQMKQLFDPGSTKVLLSGRPDYTRMQDLYNAGNITEEGWKEYHVMHEGIPAHYFQSKPVPPIVEATARINTKYAIELAEATATAEPAGDDDDDDAGPPPPAKIKKKMTKTSSKAAQPKKDKASRASKGDSSLPPKGKSKSSSSLSD